MYQILHLCRNIQRQVGGAAAGAPCNVAKSGSVSGHAILPIEQICHALRDRRATVRMSGGEAGCGSTHSSPHSGNTASRSHVDTRRHPRSSIRTSSVRGGKNSKEKKVFPLSICCCILSMIFMV